MQLQWGRAPESAETDAATKFNVWCTRLQWGRAPESAETPSPFFGVCSSGRASMGPRS